MRAIVIVGAGASKEFGIPLTADFGKLIDDAIRNDSYCAHTGGADVYFDVQAKLDNYYGDANEAHFERVYHVLHEIDALRLTPGAIAKFRPVMHPFVELTKGYSNDALKSAAQVMLRAIYAETSRVCDAPETSLMPLTNFLSKLEDRFIPRIYTTNYDDFFEQARGLGYFNGFTQRADGCHLFDPRSYWSNWEQPGCFHLHGAVRMGFPHPKSSEIEIGDIGWFDSRAQALPFSEFNGSGVNRLDGTGIVRSAIITGLDKLGRIQQSPFGTYYAGLAREVMEADVIFVLGSGLGDLHLNSWLKTARRLKPQVPLLYVNHWGGSTAEFYCRIHFHSGNLETSLYHELRVDLATVKEGEFKATEGWTIDARGTGAVWADGFQSFLRKPDVLDHVLERLGVR